MNMKDVLREELDKISPSRDEIMKLSKIAKDFISSLKEEGLRAYVGGSLAKGTLVVQEKQDVDIFVVFDSNDEIEKLEKVLGQIKLPGELKRVHGSRDYFQVVCDEAILEVIPVLDNKDPEVAENVTDISLSHVKYVVSEVKKNPAIADEIRLAKAFCRANRCYGAEGYLNGFSGYSLEVLVIYFGGFVKFLKSIEKKRVVDSLKFFRNEREVMSELNASKLGGPIVLIDPTYKYRNISAGLNSETFEKFLEVSKKFLKSPSLKFFERSEVDVGEMKELAKKKGFRFIEVDLRTDRQEGDIAGTKMKKLFRFFVSELERKQQKVMRKEFDYSGLGNVARGYLVVDEKTEIEVRGPSVGLVEAVKSFKKAKGGKIFERKGFWWFKEKISVEKVFELVKKVEREMGVSVRLV